MSLLMTSVIGHRGVASLAPENTLAGIRKAAELGVAWVELDVTLLGDGSAVMFHDARVNRTTDGKGHLKRHSMADICKLDAGSWFASEYRGEKIPTLHDALQLIRELGLGLNLELKPNRCDLFRLVDVVVKELEATGFDPDRLLVSSFNHKALVLFRARSSHRIGCLFEYLPGNWKHKARQINAVSIHLNGGKLSEKKAKAVKSSGYELYCYTVNSQSEAEKLKGWGVDGIFSDCPQDFLKGRMAGRMPAIQSILQGSSTSRRYLKSFLEAAGGFSCSASFLALRTS